ncbi:MAG: hypothetical protein JRJ84_04610 [Deltaproteobacteria bacterium]|nr:hypothetical protein [Deltaproteobacteria bacterium]
MKALGLFGVIAVAVTGCFSGSMAPSGADKEQAVGGAYYPPAPAMEESEGDTMKTAKPRAAPSRSRMAMDEAGPTAIMAPEELEEEPDDAVAGGEADDGGPELRQWFPESFLWQPLVETDESGTAMVDVRVPDTLTTWRVLALAHSQGGRQAGTVHTFDSRLPLYVDPVVPGWMYVGDRVLLPVQAVNTTDEAVDTVLEVSAVGALTGEGSVALRLPPRGSDVRRVALVAEGSGSGSVRAVLGDSDAAERQVPVKPAGRPVERTRGGTLSATRSFRIAGPEKADPVTQELSVWVFPGPLAVLQAEIERAASAAVTPWDAAYAFALASRLEQLSLMAGIEVDPKVARRLRVLAWQRVVRHSRSPDAGTAADLLAAMRDVEGHELAEELKKRLIRNVVSGQRGDGTWARQSSAPLQQVIVQTAFAARTLPDDEEGARLRASGALERYAREVKDSYTAAVVLASGVVDGDLRADLLKIVLDGVTETNGVHGVSVPKEARNAWGQRPPYAEVRAWTALALAEETDLDWRGDLVSDLMAGYDAGWGFGAGPADVIALEAVLILLPGLDREVEVVLTLDGNEVDRQQLDPAQPRVPAVLTGPPGARNPEIGLRVEPEVPGLAFVATLASWVPWSGEEQMAGVEVETEVERMKVGLDSTLTLRLSAPSGVALVVEQGLPAGATVDESSLASVGDALVDHQVFTDRVRLQTRAFRAGEVMEFPIQVRPAFAGRFQTLPLTLEATGRVGQRVFLRPVVWEVAPEVGALAVR